MKLGHARIIVKESKYIEALKVIAEADATIEEPVVEEPVKEPTE